MHPWSWIFQNFEADYGCLCEKKYLTLLKKESVLKRKQALLRGWFIFGFDFVISVPSNYSVPNGIFRFLVSYSTYLYIVQYIYIYIYIHKNVYIYLHRHPSYVLKNVHAHTHRSPPTHTHTHTHTHIYIYIYIHLHILIGLLFLIRQSIYIGIFMCNPYLLPYIYV